jgi:hypothetical protein
MCGVVFRFLKKKQTFAKNENIGTPKPRSQKKLGK